MLRSFPRTRELTFGVVGTRDRLVLTDFDLVVAGRAAQGQDERPVREHVDEPLSEPAFHSLDSALATQARQVPIVGTNTSGEVEPVLVRASGRLYLTVGSDHTDRSVERVSISDSKAACPKPLSSTAVVLEEPVDWTAIVMRCLVDGTDYQAGSLWSPRTPTEVLHRYETELDEAGRDLVLFCGTLPLVYGAFTPGRDWALSLTLPDGTEIKHGYSTSGSIL